MKSIFVFACLTVLCLSVLAVSFAMAAPLPPSDSDGDGVLDSADLCPGTPAGEVVDAQGCSFDQNIAHICIPDESLKNHGQYVSCVAKSTKVLANLFFIENNERGQIVSVAAQSDIGK